MNFRKWADGMGRFYPKCFKKCPTKVEVFPADGSFLRSQQDKVLTGDVLDNRHTVLQRVGRGGIAMKSYSWVQRLGA